MKRDLAIAVSALAVAVTAICASFSIVDESVPAKKVDAKRIAQTNLLVSDREEIDFGTVGQNQSLHASFLITNTSEDQIDILDVSKSCSCSDILLNTKTIPAGGTATAKVEWKTRLSLGVQRIPIAFSFKYSKSSDYGGSLHCSIRGRVEPDFHVVPKAVVFGKDNAASITLQNGYRAAPRILKALSSDPAVHVHLNGETVELVIAEAKNDAVLGSVLLFTDHPTTPQCEVPFSRQP